MGAKGKDGMKWNESDEVDMMMQRGLSGEDAMDEMELNGIILLVGLI